MASHSPVPPPESFFVAFVVQGEDVFKITSDSIVYVCGNSGEAAFRELPSCALQSLWSSSQKSTTNVLTNCEGWLRKWPARAWRCWHEPATPQRPISKKSRKG
jgi:hypothetical protein